jgi:hypothetical protein
MLRSRPRANIWGKTLSTWVFGRPLFSNVFQRVRKIKANFFGAYTIGANVDLLHTRIHPEIIPPRKGSQGLSCKPDLPSIFPRLGESFVL